MKPWEQKQEKTIQNQSARKRHHSSARPTSPSMAILSKGSGTDQTLLSPWLPSFPSQELENRPSDKFRPLVFPRALPCSDSRPPPRRLSKLYFPVPLSTRALSNRRLFKTNRGGGGPPREKFSSSTTKNHGSLLPQHPIRLPMPPLGPVDSARVAFSCSLRLAKCATAPPCPMLSCMVLVRCSLSSSSGRTTSTTGMKQETDQVGPRRRQRAEQRRAGLTMAGGGAAALRGAVRDGGDAPYPPPALARHPNTIQGV